MNVFESASAIDTESYPSVLQTGTKKQYAEILRELLIVVYKRTLFKSLF